MQLPFVKLEESLKRLKALPLGQCLDLALRIEQPINEFFLFKRRFEDLERDYREKILLREDYIIQQNRLTYDWYEVLDTLNEDTIQEITTHAHFNLEQDEILRKFNFASHLLDQWKSTFIKDISASHLVRSETKQILDWIDAPISDRKNGIALLVGEPGMGKSVVMGDVLRELNARGTAVLGIKAEQYCSDDAGLLKNKLSEFSDMAIALARGDRQVVVLIDQIDALSQMLSARREFLDSYTEFVLSLLDIQNIRIVLSCRDYDIQNDQAFSFYQKKEVQRFTLGKLGKDELNAILKRLTPTPRLSNELLQLLQTPLHLDLFCQIYRPNLPVEKIKTLRNLFMKLWDQKVEQIEAPGGAKVAPDRVSQLIYSLADEMHETTLLTVSRNRRVIRQFQAELEYLKSSGIVLESENEIYFFHQTFYEFTFAKHYIERELPIEQYILEKNQVLHVRASLKMMMEYLREFDPLKYFCVLKTVLGDEQYLFHIKSLLLSLLGHEKNPSEEEMRFVRDSVFPNGHLFEVFVSSVKSREWLLLLLEHREMLRVTESLPDVTLESASALSSFWGNLFLRHLPECRAEILGFMAGLPKNEHWKWLVQRVLDQIEIWDNQQAFQLFDAYSATFVDVFFNGFLEKAAASNPGKMDWVMGHLRAVIEKDWNMKQLTLSEIDFSSGVAKLISHFAQNYPEPTFDLLLEYQKRKASLTKHKWQIEPKSSIYTDLLLLREDTEDSRYEETGLFGFLAKCVRSLADKRLTRFTQFVHESLDSNSSAILLLLVGGFRANPSAYVNEIVRFFHIFIEKCGFDAGLTLSWNAKQLLKEVNQYFSESQKRDIVHLILQMDSQEEKEWAIEKNHPEWIGNKRFQWLKCLPQSVVSLIPEAEKIFEQSSIMFSEEEREPNRIGAYRVGPPMEEEEYENMSSEEWLASFIKYDENYIEDLGSEKGGFKEHAQRFQEEVKRRPDFFYPILEGLVSRTDLPITYLTYGLEGLKMADFPAERLLSLFKKIDTTDFPNWGINCLVDICGSFANKKIEDDFIIQFLVKMATRHPSIGNDAFEGEFDGDYAESVFIAGFNTVRGKVVHILPYFFYFKKHEDLIFETLEQVAESDGLSIRCQIMHRLALLINLNEERALRLFLRLARDDEKAMMEHSEWSAQRLAKNNFDAMRHYFEKALAYPKTHKSMGIILSQTLIFGRGEALDLLNRFFEISEEAKVGAIEVAAYNMRAGVGNQSSKSLQLYRRFLGESGEKVVKAYHSAFHDLKPESFEYLRPLIIQYAEMFTDTEYPHFWLYLNTCAIQHPESCLDLMEHVVKRPNTIHFGRLYSDEPLKVVLTAYNVLWGRKLKNPEKIQRALHLFDVMLLDDRFRQNAEKVLNEVER